MQRLRVYSQRETLELESLKRLRLEPSQVETGSKLGNGHFGDVFRATLTTRPSLVKPTKITVALKKLRPLGDPDQKLRVVVVSHHLPKPQRHSLIIAYVRHWLARSWSGLPSSIQMFWAFWVSTAMTWTTRTLARLWSWGYTAIS